MEVGYLEHPVSLLVASGDHGDHSWVGGQPVKEKYVPALFHSEVVVLQADDVFGLDQVVLGQHIPESKVVELWVLFKVGEIVPAYYCLC